MGWEWEQIGVKFASIYGQRAGRLHSINMERNLPSTADAANLCYRFNSAYFVVGIHDRNEDGLIANCSTDIIWIDTSIAINRHIGSFKAETLQVLARVKHRMVFYGRGNDMVALFLRGKCYTLDRQVIALGTIACKGNLGRPAPEDVSYLFASTINGLHSMTTQCVDTARIAILSCEVRQHSLQYTRIERCSSGMIKVDNTFCHCLFFLRPSIAANLPANYKLCQLALSGYCT